ncbi:hypothetical protein POM88_041033 [Heracleum sosnowskyi]|uniref:Srp40 C-terminal domain-containing protein n=1 Tax=Heracleum sosnowskyi TaxID=360622 RepID=A0AAD8HG08_9APIA|nr:hypothetical protein POM88_041033 [Heracleum sosnowskyi]
MKVVVEDQSKDMSTAACDVEKEKKSSKKRKRFVSDENEIQSDNNEAGEESKPKKVKGSEKLKKKDKSTIVGGNEESEKENTRVANIDSTKASKKVPDEHENEDLENIDKVQLDHSNGDLEKSGYKSSNQKSTKKQRIGSAEPKMVNAFQRVKIDEVEFADEKLQDNSYRAKSGAEIGYGAKAQEVLGQVRRRVNFFIIMWKLMLLSKTLLLSKGTSFASGIIDLGALHVSQTTSFEKVWATYEGGLDNQGATFYEPSSIAEVLLDLGRIQALVTFSLTNKRQSKLDPFLKFLHH